MVAQPRQHLGRPRDADLAAKRREEILDAAIPIFARFGFRNTEVQLVADKLGVGKGTIYRYFPSKRELFLKAVDHGIRRMHERVESSVPPHAELYERMEHSIRAYLTFFDEHPEVVELLMQERAEFKDRKQQTYFEHSDRNKLRWRAACDKNIANGRLRDLPFDQGSDFIQYLIYGTMFTNYFRGLHKSIAQQTREILDILWFGILSDKERARMLPQVQVQEPRP